MGVSRRLAELLLAVLAFAMAPAALAQPALIADRAGAWLCDPAQTDWPYIQIDFEEDAYRRCDQNTCVSYPILDVEPAGETVLVRFALAGEMVTGPAGGPYTERLDIGAGETRTAGTCAFRPDNSGG